MKHSIYQSDNRDRVKRSDFTKLCFDWIEALIFALLLSILLLTFVFKVVTVNGQSMENTLHDRERLFVRNFFYTPQNGDVIVIGPIWDIDEHVIVKRIIAKGGQTLDINFDTGEVTVDGVVLDEPYIKELTKQAEGGEIPSVVPEGKLFVMGDNRNYSLDSRSDRVGLIDEDQIIAKAEFVVWPFDVVRRI